MSRGAESHADEWDLEAIGCSLPIAAHAEELRTAVQNGCAVVEAPPGTGKTTFVPPLVASSVDPLAPSASISRVVVTQPRRVAARAAAARLAQLTGTQVGGLVGHVVRRDARVSDRTRVEFCTTGVLLRRLLTDPELPGIHTVILDEVHERHLEDDLALGMLVELRELRPDLRLIAMSATLDSDRFARLLGDAQVVRVPSTLHPLEVRWQPPASTPITTRGVDHAFLDHVADCTADAASGIDPDASALVFLPGAWEVDQVCARLRGRTTRPVLPLHGQLDASEQDAAIQGPEPRIVVSTAVAESSVTVAGVRLVVDSGLAREPRFDSIRGITGLVTVTASRAAATQRAGRAARLGPGIVIRCLAEHDWARLPAEPTPEVRTADLTQAALDLAVWGAPRGRGLALPDPFPDAAFERAERTLQALDAIDADGQATAHGRRLAAIPADPRLAHAQIRAVEDGIDAARARRVVDELTDARRLPDDLGRTGLDRRALAHIVAHAFPDRIGRLREPDSREYLLTGGTGAEAPRAWGDPPEWVAVADIDRGPRGARIRSALPIEEDLALHAAAALHNSRTEATFHPRQRRVQGRRVERLGAIELTSTPTSPDPTTAAAAVHEALRRDGLQVVGWDDRAEALRTRLAFLHHHLGDPWPSMDTDHLIATADHWLAPELQQLATGTPARDLDATAALRRALPWPEAGRLDELAPERLEVPSGSRIRVDYPDDPEQAPVVAVKLQECFGLTETPRLADGRAPVVFHLLSPAQRPLAVTDDLASFWAGAYVHVRAENRGRYSKHPWPEDPLTAPPQRGTKKSGR